ncbi:MAG: serine/threonine-protein kinase, partial [Planctomycetota bacterium]
MSDSHSNRRHRINLHAEEALGRALAELGYVDAAALPAPWAEFIRRAEAGELLGFATVLVEHQLATLDQVDEALEHVEQSGTKVHTRPVRDISSDEALGRTLMARGLLTKEQNKAHWKEFMKQAPNDPQLHYANVLHWAGAVSADQLAEAGVEPGVLDDDAFGETQMEVSRSDAMSAMYEYGTTRGGSSSSGNGDAADPFGMGSVGNPFADPGNDGSADPFADAAVMAPGSDPFAAADAEYAASGRGNSPGGSGSTDFFAGAEAAAMDAAAHDDAPLADPFADAMGARDAFSDSSPSIDPFRDADAAANDETKLDEFPADPFADAANDETQHDEFPADPFADAGAGVSGFADTDDATHDTYVDEQFPADPFADAMEPPPGYEVERGDVDPFADTSVGPLDPELEGMLDEVVQTAATVEDAPADDADAVVVSAADIAAEPESDVDIAMPAPKATRKVVDATADDDDDAGPVLARSDVNVPGVSAPAPDIDMEGEELLGRALWSAGAITVEQLDKSWKEFIARVKDGEDVRFGQVLIERGTLQPQQLIDIAQKIESGEVKVPPRIDVLKTAERQAKALLDSGVTVEELAPAWQEFMDRASSGESVSFADVAAEMGVARPHHSERLAAVAVPGDGDMSESFFDINLATDDLPDSISSITKRVVPEDLRASIREVTSQVSGDEGLEQLDDEPDAVAVDGESVVSAADVPNADADGTPLDAGTLERMPDTRLLDLDGMEAAMSARTANASESSIDLSGLTGELGEGVFEDDVDENLPTANFAAEEEYGRALLAEGLVTLEELDVAWVEFESRVEKGEDCTLEEVLGLRGIVPRDKLAEVRSRMDAGESFHPPSVDFKAEEKLGRALLADRTVRLDKIDAAWQHFLDRVRAGEATSFAQELLEQGLVSKQELLDLRERISKGTARVLPRIELQKEETLGRELIEKGLVGGEEIDETWREFVSRARSGESVSFGGMLVSRGLISRHILEEMGARVELPAEEELPLVESFFDIALDQIEVPDSLSISAELVPKDVIDSIRSATGADDAPDAHLESLDDDPHSEIADVVESQELRDLMTAETQEVVLSAADTPSDGDAGDLADPFADAVDDDAVSIGNTLESLDDEEEDDDALELPEPVLPGYELPPTGVDTRSLNFGAIGAEFGGEMFTDEAEAREPYDSAADEALGRALLVSRLITMDTLDVAFVEFTDRMDRGERVTFDQVLTGKYHIDAAAIADLRARLAAGEEFNPQEIDFAVELAFGRAVQESGRLGLKQIDRAWEDFRDRAQAGEPITFAEAMVEKGLVDAATIAELRRKFDAGELQTTAIINYKSEEKLARSLIEASEISAEALDPVWQQFLTRARAGESVKLADLLQEQGLVDADTLSRHSGERVRDARLATFIDLDANQASLPSTLLIQPGQLTGALAAVTAAASLPTDADEDEIPDAMFDDAVLDDGESEMAETLEMKKPPADWRTAKPAAGPRVTPSGRITAVAGLSDDDLSTDELHFYYEQEQYGLAAVRHGYVRAHQVKPVWEEMLDRIDSGEKTITLLGLLVGYGVLTVEQADAIRDEGVPDADTAVRQRAALQARQRDGVLDTADEEEGALVSPQVITNPADINPIGSLFLDAGALDFALDDADAPDDFVFQEFSESKEIEIKKLPPITVNATTLGSAGGTQQGAASSTQHALPQPTQAQIEAIYANDAAFLRQQEDYGFKAIDRKWLVADAVHPVWDEMIIRRVHGDKVSDLPALFVERGILTPAQADELRKAEATPQVHAAKKLAAQQPAGSLFIDASALDSALDFDEDEFVMPELQVDDREDSLIPDVQAYTAPTSDESINMMAGDEVRRATAAAGAGNTQMMGDDDRVNAGVTGPGVNDSIAAQMTLFEIGAGTTSGIGRTEGGSSPGSRSGDGSLRSGRRFGSFGTSSSAGASGMGLPPRTLGATAGNTSDAGGAGIARQMGFGNLVDLSGKNKGFTDRMGRYLIMGRIGKGGMGEILNARDADLNRDLAMKVMLAGSDAKRSQLEKFLVEAQVTGQLEHPNIVPVHELGLTNDGRLYFTMKYVRGKSMQQILEAMGEREIERAARKSRGSRGSRSKADVSGIAVTAAATATGGGSVTGGPGGQTGSGTGTGTGTAAGGVTAGSSRGGGRSSSGSGSSDALLSGPMTGVQTGPTKYKIREYTLAELLEIYLKICDAVAFAHSRGVVHRDLKPENVMVGEFGEVQVMDWGLAKVRGKEDRVEAGVKIDLNAGDIGLAVRGAEANIDVVKTMDGTILGTPVYMPPEQARGDIDQIDHRSDIYSLGAILYQVLTLKQPLVGRTAIEILVKVAKGDIQWPSERTPERNVSAELEAVVKKAMAAKKEKRYDTVEDLKSDVRAFLEGRALSAVSYSPMALAMKWVKRNKTLAGGIAAVFVVMIGMIAIFNAISEASKSAFVEARKVEAA